MYSDPSLDMEPLGSKYFDLLRAHLEQTFATCSFYRKRGAKTKAEISKLRGPEDLLRIPLLGPHEVEALTEADLLPDAYVEAIRQSTLGAHIPPFAKKFTSSGSTGNPKIAYYTLEDWRQAHQMHVRSLSHARKAGAWRVLSGFHPGHIAGKMTEDALSAAGDLVENKHFARGEGELLEQLRSSMTIWGGVTCLALPPRTPSGSTQKGHALSGLLSADVDNLIGSKIQYIYTSGAVRDLPDDDLKQRTWDANEIAGKPRCQIVDLWGTAEVAGTAAAECEYNDGLHILPGLTFTEVVNEKTGRHARNGERGFVVCSSLRQGSRYIRYMVGDDATYVDEPCRCGRRTARLKAIERVLDRNRLVDGCSAGW